MTRYQLNRLRADRSVLEFLNKNEAVISVFPALMISVNLLRGKLGLVDEALQIQMTTLKGNRANRRRYKARLALSSIYLCAGMYAYGKDNGDYTFVEASKLNESDLNKLGELDMAALCEALLEQARPVETELEAHGIESGFLDLIAYEIGTYRALVSGGRGDVVKRAAATKAIPVLQSDIAEHFSLRLDKQITRLRENYPLLEQEYFHTRRILKFGNHRPASVETRLLGGGDPRPEDAAAVA